MSRWNTTNMNCLVGQPDATHMEQPLGCFPIDVSFPLGYKHFYGRKIRFPIRHLQARRKKAA